MREPHAGIDDTSAEARAVVNAAYRRMTPAEKLMRVRQLTIATARLTLEGLRRRHPDASDAELLGKLRRIRLGERLADILAMVPGRDA